MTKIEPPLVRGEWVKLKHVEGFGDGTKTTWIEGEVEASPRDAGEVVVFKGNGFVDIDHGWEIVERRPPKPEWMDADAILVDWSYGQQDAYPRRAEADFGGRSAAGWLKQPEVACIRGLYLRDET